MRTARAGAPRDGEGAPGTPTDAPGHDQTERVHGHAGHADHEHGHGHEHEHGGHEHGPRLATVLDADPHQRRSHRRRLAIALGLALTVLVVEVVGSVVTGSLALLSDAGHVATDAVGLSLALAAIAAADRSSGSAHHTFGLYRLEVLAALLNAALLVGVGVYVLVEAVGRLREPEPVASGPLLFAATVGLLANLAAYLVLRGAAEHSLNVEGAYLEVVADLVGSVAVVAGAGLIALTGRTWIDPVLALGVGAFVVPRAVRLGRKGLRVLLQTAPAHLDVAAIERDLRDLPDVVDVHDLHLWTLTSGMEVLSAHVMTVDGADSHAVLDGAREVLADRHGIHHATVQVEPESHVGCDELDW